MEAIGNELMWAGMVFIGISVLALAEKWYSGYKRRRDQRYRLYRSGGLI